MEASQEVFEVNAVGHFEKITTDDLKSLISFYQKNPVLWNPSHPQYRNHALKNKAKEELVKALGSKYRIEVLEKKFHSLRTSMRREVKRILETEGSANDEEPPTKKPKKPWVHYEDMLFMKEDIERGNFFVPGEGTIITNYNHILKIFSLRVGC